MANEYTDLAALRLALGIQPDDTGRDALLTQALAAASRGIDTMAGRRFYLDPDISTRTYTLRGRVVRDCEEERLLVDDIGSVTGLAVETGTGDSWSPVTAYETGPENAVARRRPITSLTLVGGTWGSGAVRVRVTARWGWPSVPDEVAQAAQIQAARLFKRKDSPEGVTGSAEWGVVRLSRVDPDVWALVQHLVLPGFG